LVSHVPCETAMIYQDRLGTNTRHNSNKRRFE
jgi:hypothetical protein